MSYGMKPVKFIHGTNTSQEALRENVEWALAHARVRDYWDRRCVIVGGGPSISKHWDDVDADTEENAVFALNNAWRDYRYHTGRFPQFVVMMDAREENVEFVGDCHEATWVVASQCHPKVWHRLNQKRQNVVMWHAAGSEAVTEKGLRGIAGGGTVLSRAINIAVDMGYRHITLAGVDSSYDGDEHHAYRQPMNDDDKRIRVATPAGTEFVTTPELAEQADTVMNQMLSLQSVMGVTFEIIGDGLLPALWREHNALRADLDKWEPEKYRRMWEHHLYRGHSPAVEKIEQIIKHLPATAYVRFGGPDTRSRLIDFGCGPGLVGYELAVAGWHITGVDFAANCLDRNSKISFVEANLWNLPETVNGDAGICIDVMEHIPPEKVDAVLSNIARAVPMCVFSICYQPDRMGALIGEKLHLSVHPEDWWLKKLGEHFASVRAVDGLIICEAD